MISNMVFSGTVDKIKNKKEHAVAIFCPRLPVTARRAATHPAQRNPPPPPPTNLARVLLCSDPPHTHIHKTRTHARAHAHTTPRLAGLQVLSWLTGSLEQPSDPGRPVRPCFVRPLRSQAAFYQAARAHPLGRVTARARAHASHWPGPPPPRRTCVSPAVRAPSIESIVPFSRSIPPRSAGPPGRSRFTTYLRRRRRGCERALCQCGRRAPRPGRRTDTRSRPAKAGLTRNGSGPGPDGRERSSRRSLGRVVDGEAGGSGWGKRSRAAQWSSESENSADCGRPAADSSAESASAVPSRLGWWAAQAWRPEERRAARLF